MSELEKLRQRPAVLMAIGVGCLTGLIWAAYYALVKHAGLIETLLAFLGGIPTVAFIAWIIIGQARASSALRKDLRAAGTPVEVIGPFGVAGRIGVGCLAPTLSVLSGLGAGIGLAASGLYRQWSHPDQIAFLLLVPVATFGIGLMSMQSRAIGRRAALVAVTAALASVAVAGFFGLAGYLMYPPEPHL